MSGGAGPLPPLRPDRLPGLRPLRPSRPPDTEPVPQREKGPSPPVCSDRLSILKARYPHLQRNRRLMPGLPQACRAERKTSPPALMQDGWRWPDKSPEEPPREEAPAPPPRGQTFAAVVRQSAYGEGGLDTAECPQCRRRFVLDRLPIHLGICNKVATNAAMRGVFCSDTQRQPRPDRPAPSPSAPPRAPHSRPARKRKAGPAGADPPPPSEPEGQAEVREDDWLRQRSAEVQFTLRMDIRDSPALREAQTTVAALCGFTEQLVEVAGGLALPPEVVFQELLARVAEQQPDFDSQHGVGAVPMHQAKVLPRGKRLANAQVGAALEAAVGTEGLRTMVQQVRALRRMLKVKVEDKNDLRMAAAALKDAHVFFEALQRCAADRGVAPYALWGELAL